MCKITLELTKPELERLTLMSIHFNIPLEEIAMIGVRSLEELETMADAMNGRR